MENWTMNELHGREDPADAGDRRWRIVVADDIMDNADSLSAVLRIMGHVVCTAYDGHSALAVHELFTPDAYVLDLGMPGVDGFETCRAIRQRPLGLSVAIVALSGWGRNEDLSRALEVGFSGFLMKPALPRDIIQSFAHAAQRREPRDHIHSDGTPQK
jgi:CheY-like chemotaxis protein